MTIQIRVQRKKFLDPKIRYPPIPFIWISYGSLGNENNKQRDIYLKYVVIFIFFSF